MAAAVTGADQWGSLATDAVVPVWKARPPSLQLGRGYKTQHRPALIKEDFKVLTLCFLKPRREGRWWVVVPIGTSWEANSCGRCFLSPLCCAGSSQMHRNQRRFGLNGFQQMAACATTTPSRGRLEKERLWGKNRLRRVSRWCTQREGG